MIQKIPCTECDKPIAPSSIKVHLWVAHHEGTSVPGNNFHLQVNKISHVPVNKQLTGKLTSQLQKYLSIFDTFERIFFKKVFLSNSTKSSSLKKMCL